MIIIKKTANENCKIYFVLDKDRINESSKKKIDKMSNDLNITIEQLIQNKKKNIVSRFLKGYKVNNKLSQPIIKPSHSPSKFSKKNFIMNKLDLKNFYNE